MRQSPLLIATHNRGKAQEISALLHGIGYDVTSAGEWQPPLPVPEEVFQTFAENALLKARHYHSLTGYLALADDSGLIVDALGGAPGVLSARYAGPNASSEDLVSKILEQLKDVPWEDRGARFACAVAIVGRGVERTFEGSCQGIIAFEAHGTGGFGFDPVFFDPRMGKTFAEMTREEKATRSHRGQALEKARQFLRSTEYRVPSAEC